ncbi:hypothetical protein B0T20DRAFT_407369 [Sordaria brevicollis]|uniref:Uncharacterized protein n=1 Tax=Sordaria brevicollis TaxID=83679 RepID=A0AAE0UD86_SORBR|nr:hypothetical protein B0T20DRAFT_407369 [Sordaria brevicollis]
MVGREEIREENDAPFPYQPLFLLSFLLFSSLLLSLPLIISFFPPRSKSGSDTIDRKGLFWRRVRGNGQDEDFTRVRFYHLQLPEFQLCGCVTKDALGHHKVGFQLVTGENANERSSMCREIRYACPAICRGVGRFDIKTCRWLSGSMNGCLGYQLGDLARTVM